MLPPNHPLVSYPKKGNFVPPSMCPLCQEVETVAHSSYGCKFLRLSIGSILGCYGDLSQLPFEEPFRMSLTQHSVTLTTPQGMLLWCARHAN